jgi:hypothetical protein
MYARIYYSKNRNQNAIIINFHCYGEHFFFYLIINVKLKMGISYIFNTVYKFFFFFTERFVFMFYVFFLNKINFTDVNETKSFTQVSIQ